MSWTAQSSLMFGVFITKEQAVAIFHMLYDAGELPQSAIEEFNLADGPISASLDLDEVADFTVSEIGFAGHMQGSTAYGDLVGYTFGYGIAFAGSDDGEPTRIDGAKLHPLALENERNEALATLPASIRTYVLNLSWSVMLDAVLTD